MVVYPETSTVTFHGKAFRAMDQPKCLASQRERNSECPTGTSQAKPVPIVRVPFSVADLLQHRTSLTVETRSERKYALAQPLDSIKPNKVHDPEGKWKTVNVTVLVDNDIPHRMAMHIPDVVPEATVGCDICLEGPNQIKRLAVESTLSTVCGDTRPVRPTGDPIKLLTKAMTSQLCQIV